MIFSNWLWKDTAFKKGHIVKEEDTKGAARENIIKLKVLDSVFAGGYSEKVLEKGQAVRIMTGAKILKGADCVIRQENTNYDEITNVLLLYIKEIYKWLIFIIEK